MQSSISAAWRNHSRAIDCESVWLKGGATSGSNATRIYFYPAERARSIGAEVGNRAELKRPALQHLFQVADCRALFMFCDSKIFDAVWCE